MIKLENTKEKLAVTPLTTSRHQGRNCYNLFSCDNRCLDVIIISQNTQIFKWNYMKFSIANTHFQEVTLL